MAVKALCWWSGNHEQLSDLQILPGAERHPGQTGGSTSFGALISATGGTGGSSASGGAGGAGAKGLVIMEW